MEFMWLISYFVFIHFNGVCSRTVSRELVDKDFHEKHDKHILLDYYVPEDKKFDVDAYLERYGYIAAPTRGKLKYTHSEEDRNYAISLFQKNAHLKVTGELDKATVAAMRRPRCGVTDYIVPKAGYPQEYNAGEAWQKDTIKWNVEKYSNKLTEAEQREAIAFAFGEWTAVCGLDATPADVADSDVDIQIQFASGDHGNGTDTAFDGKGGVVGHAFGPPDGRVHFDEDEQWALHHSFQTVDFRAVAVHELGHALGLYHSFTRGSIMSPFYSGANFPNTTLHADDISGIQSLYGPASTPSPTTETILNMETPKPNHTAHPVEPVKKDKTDKEKKKSKGKKKKKGGLKPENMNLCNSTFDAVAEGYDGNINLFIGGYVYKVREHCYDGSTCVVDGYPKPIRKVYERAPRKVLAAAYVPDHRRRTYLFSGKKLWRYTKNVLDEGYPKRLNKTEIPHRPTAAVILKNQFADYHFYIFGGKKYFWEINMDNDKIADNKMKVSTYWNRMPKKPDAITQFYAGNIYVFKRNSYLKYDHLRGHLQKKRPIGPAWLSGDCGFSEK